MSLAQYFAILRARHRLALSILLGVLALGLLYVLLTPRQYESEAAVLVDVRATDPFSQGFSNLAVTSGAYIATQADVIGSERVAKKVVEILKLADDPASRAAWQKEGSPGTLEAWLAADLDRGLKIDPSADSSVIQVVYRSTDPKFAADAANAFVQGYLDTTLDLRAEPAKQNNAFYQERVREARDALEQAQARLSRYQQDKGLLQTDENKDLDNARLAALSDQLVQAEAALAGSAGRGKAAQRNGAATNEALADPVLTTLKSQLAQQRAHYNELAARLGPAHPQMLEVQSSIAELQRRIVEETANVSGSVGSVAVVDEGRVAALREAVDRQRERVLALKVKRDDAAVLERDVELAKRSYDNLMEFLSKSELQAQATQTNVGVLRNAIPSALPASPKVPLVMGAAAAAGTLLALLAALLVEHFDRRLRTLSDVTGTLRQTLVGIMPPPEGRQRRALLPGALAAAAPRLGRRRALPELGMK